MPETACLHIQAREPRPDPSRRTPRLLGEDRPRILLRSPSDRILDLADEECRLRLAGGDLAARARLRPPASVSIDGRSVETTRPLLRCPASGSASTGSPSRLDRHQATPGVACVQPRLPIGLDGCHARRLRPAVAPAASRDDTDGSVRFRHHHLLAPHLRRAPEYDHVSPLEGTRREAGEAGQPSRPRNGRWENRWRAAGERVRMRPRRRDPADPPPPASPVMPRIPPRPRPSDEFESSCKVSQDATELRNRARRDTAPIDRRPAIS